MPLRRVALCYNEVKITRSDTFFSIESENYIVFYQACLMLDFFDIYGLVYLL